MLHSFKAVLALLAILSITGCQKETDDRGTIYCAPVDANIALQLVDKNSGKDLFFGADAKFKPHNLKLYASNYKNKNDTIPLTRFASENSQIFVFTALQGNKNTVLLKIDDLPMDTLRYTSVVPPTICSPLSIKEAYFNGAAIIPDNGLLVLKK